MTCDATAAKMRFLCYVADEYNLIDRPSFNFSSGDINTDELRGFTTTTNIKAAIEQSGLRQFAEDRFIYDFDSFERFHRNCSRQPIDTFEQLYLGSVSYGRVAKIISIYLKTSIILLPTSNFLL